MNQADTQRDARFEFKIDGEVLYAPHESATAEELIQIAIDANDLDPVEGGYDLEDGKGNVLQGNQEVHLNKNNVFFATEKEPGQASLCRLYEEAFRK